MPLSQLEQDKRYEKQTEWNESVITELKKIVEGNRAIFEQVRVIRMILEKEKGRARACNSL
jgi:hypothetical protein